MLRDADVQTGSEQSRGCGDVEGADGTASCAAGVHQPGGVIGRQMHHCGPKRVGRTGHLLRRLTLHAEAHEQRRDLRRRRLALHHRTEGRA